MINNKQVERVVREFRRLTDVTGKNPLRDVLKREETREVERVKANLIYELFILEEEFCNENGWASTNPLAF